VTLVLRPSRSNYAFGGVFLFLALLLLVIVQSRIHGLSDAILASVVVGGLALLGISDLLSAALAKVTVDGDTVLVRDRLGRHRCIARGDLSHAAIRSIFAPRRYGGNRTNAFLLVGKNGRCLVRLPEDDYGAENLERLVEALGLNRPHTQQASVRQINREFPDAYAFDYQRVAIAGMIILAVILAVAASAILIR
jgi:hypothetical protein